VLVEEEPEPEPGLEMGVGRGLPEVSRGGDNSCTRSTKISRAPPSKKSAISKDPRVKSCWSTKGQLKFILLKNEKEIKKVSSLLDPLDTILK
jgi:hypothetical protein